MLQDPTSVEKLVQIITREVLLAIAEYDHTRDGKGESGADSTSQVVNAGAARLTATLGAVPQDAELAKMIDHTLL